MNSKERNMIDILCTLRDKFGVVGLKAEFEAEGSRLEEVMRLKELATKANLPLALKVGGCEAITDMYMAKAIGASRVVGPMVESAYALKKYLISMKKAFPGDDTTKYINIETENSARKSFIDMLNLPEINELDGVVIGRGDLAGSMGLTRQDVDSDRVCKVVKHIIELNDGRLDLTIGGGITAKSIPFLKSIQKDISQFETRKVIFSSQEGLKDATKGIELALMFEQLWLENKRDYYLRIADEDLPRLKALEARRKK